MCLLSRFIIDRYFPSTPSTIYNVFTNSGVLINGLTWAKEEKRREEKRREEKRREEKRREEKRREEKRREEKRRTRTLPSGPKSSFQMRASFVFHLETKVLESGGRVEKLIAQVA